MRNNRKASIDGFIPRRPDSQLGELNQAKNPDSLIRPIDRTLHTGDNISTDRVGEPRLGREFGRTDVDESLRQIDDDPFGDSLQPQPEGKSGFKFKLGGKGSNKRSRGGRKGKKELKKKSKAKRIVFWVSMVVIAALVGIGGFLAYKAIVAGGNVFQGNLFDLIQNQPLKKDDNGRSNFLVFGTAEDSEGGMHGGANLTDSIMVVSIDQEKNNAYMLSLPRDLWVEYNMPSGSICSVGYQGKLNAQYFCASNDGQNEKAGAEALSKKVGDITGLDIQYFVHLNFTAVTESVDAVGGVDVTIESDDPRGILDRNFDWKCNYQCYYVNYKNGEKVHLDGEHALALARARNAAGGYGLTNGNFDREKNQQMIIKALLEKAVSAGTLTNLGAVTGLIDALGNNLRTNIETKEVRTLMDLGTKIAPESIISLSLNNEDEMLVTTGNYNGQSIVQPVKGLLDYSEINSYVKKEISSDPFLKEDPQVMVLNGTSIAGLAQTASYVLEDDGFIVDSIGNAPEGSYEKVEIYQISNDKPATLDKLKRLYGVTPKIAKPPVSVLGETDFVIIIGDASVVEG